MQISKPAKVVSTVILGVLLTKFAHSQVKTDTLLFPTPKDTSAQARDTAKVTSIPYDSLKAADSSNVTPQAGAGPEPKQDSLEIKVSPTHVTVTCVGSDGKMIKGMSINIESELSEIGVRPDGEKTIDEEHIVIKNGKIYVLFDGYSRALTLKPKAGDVDSGVAPAPKK